MRAWTIAIMTLLAMAGYPSQAAPLVVQGGADLSVVDWDKEGVVALSGDWQFYWNQLLSPDDIAQGRGKLSAYLTPEAQWQQTTIPGVDIGRIGAATYFLRLYLNEPMDLTLELPLFCSASRVWINRELRQDFGRVSLTAEDAEGFVRDNRLRFQGTKGENTIAIQMSNFLSWYGGGSLPVRLGQTEVMQYRQIMAGLKDAICFGFILFMSLYHVYIRFILKRSNGALFFGLFSFGIAMRMAVVGEGQVAYSIWPSLPMNLRFFIEYLELASSVALLLSFYRELYPHETPKILYHPPIYISILYSIGIVVSSPLYYPAVLDWFQLLVLICSFISLGSLIIAARRRRDGARLLLTSNFMFFLTLANDLAYSQRIIHTVPMVHYGLIIVLFSQAIILAQRFGRSHQRAEQAEQEVTLLNHNLEEKILERTEQINTILSHARSGFLLIDCQGRLQTGYTSSCETILGQSLNIGEALPHQLGFANRLRVQFSLAVKQIFEADLPFEVAIQQLPSRFPMGQRMISLQGAAVKPRDSAIVTAVLLTINDVTDLVAAEEGLRRADVLIHILEDQDAFRIFLADFKKDLATAQKAIIEQDATALHSTLHTMKGNAASFNLEDWVNRLHRMEEQEEISVSDIQHLIQEVRQFLRLNEGILHLDFDNPMRSVFAVDQNDLNTLKDTLAPVAPPAAIARVEVWSRSVKALPLKSYTNPLIVMVGRVSRQLQKKVVLHVEGADMKVDSAYSRLLTTLPHLIRNALVHGIEDPEDRAGKAEQASITLRFTAETDGGLMIDIIDDGRGLDADRIRSHATEQGLIPDGVRLSEEQTFALIFHPNFSTAEKISDLAGRGMGLAAVASAVQELGGRYQVKSQRNQGLHLTIHVPPPDYADSGRALTAS